MVETFFKTARPRSQKSKRTAWEREWDRNRALALKRDGHRCQLPGCDRRADIVHHTAGRRVPDANRLDRLMSLCGQCHIAVHSAPESSYANGWMERHG
jgi:5-methylcytosine-specific restriction endonuclease McrA